MYFAVFLIQHLFDKLKKVCLEKEVLGVLVVLIPFSRV
jgi:hypothetical protein